MIEEKKISGSYYTPVVLSRFLVNHIFNKYISNSDGINILEPSCGDGEFIDALIPHIAKCNVEVDLVEIDSKELNKSTSKLSNHIQLEKIRSHHQDFLDFIFPKPYSLIIGNPPYISKRHLSDNQVTNCKKICKPFISGEVKNIWPAFLIKAIENLTPDGIMCFVLPSELLQVKYTSGLRKLILDSFDRVEIFAFNELIFEKTEQDVVAIVGIKNHTEPSEHGVSFYQVEKLEDLTIPDYTEMNFNVHRERLDKWTNYILSDHQLNNVDEVVRRSNLSPISFYCKKAEVGIVTAANGYFIKKQSELNSYNLNDYIKPILQRSSHVNNTITISDEYFKKLKIGDKAVNLVCFDNVSKDQLPKSAQAFIEEGEKQLFHKRFKMTQRTNWFYVPSRWSSDAVFCKRSHWYPRIFLNEAKVLVTDSFYRVVPKELYRARNLVFCFYNSLTLVLAELEGRFYGGGVLELIPSEFKALLVPYNDSITQDQYNILEGFFKKGAPIDQILDFTDPILLPGVQKTEIVMLREMRQSLFDRRTKFQKRKDNISSDIIIPLLSSNPSENAVVELANY